MTNRNVIGGLRQIGRRTYRVLAIESSCDDCCVAIINRPNKNNAYLERHIKSTLNSCATGGVIPTDALTHHLSKLAPIVNEAVRSSNTDNDKISLICATQGPGFYSSLAAGMQLGKGLSIAWNVPFVPVHHMLGHLLTPRFNGGPRFPFLSLLVSGGHTMLVHSKSLYDHKILLNTIDISVGNSLDKCARLIGIRGTMLGREMHQFIDKSTPRDKYDFIQALDGYKKRVPAFSFAHYVSVMQRMAKELNVDLADLAVGQRQQIAASIEDSMFSHIIQKIQLTKQMHPEITDLPLVCSGGVSANMRLRQMLNDSQREVIYPDPQWCTDNALMIGWAGIEMFENEKMDPSVFGNSLTAEPVAKWPLDELVRPSR